MLVNGKKADHSNGERRRGHPALIRMDLLADILAYEGSAGGGGLAGVLEAARRRHDGTSGG